jgi:hypothetical protein
VTRVLFLCVHTSARRVAVLRRVRDEIAARIRSELLDRAGS